MTVKAEILQIKNSSLKVNFEGAFNEQQKQKILPWINEMANAVSSVYGEFPLNQATIKIIRSYSWREPVPWGEVDRANTSQIILHVNPNFNIKTIRADWTAAHEMSHLFLPYVGSRNSWFSEGLASYYQNITRGSVGLLSERQTWQKLYHGFRRGHRNALRKPMSLARADRQRGNNMRIYWSGAAYFLQVDLALRKESKGNASLAKILKLYKDCCLPNHNVTSVHKVIEQLDKLAGSDVFYSHYQQIINSKEFPDYQKSFKELGIKTGWGGVSFEKDQNKQLLRSQILLFDYSIN